MTGNPQSFSYRLMTYNIGGGRKRHMSDKPQILKVIQDTSPDILAVQEVVQWCDAEGLWHSDLDEIIEALGHEFELSIAPTLTMKDQMHPNNKAMVDALLSDYQDWQKGNAVVSRWPFHRLGSPHQPGAPHSVPLHRSPVYEGNRDTEPRAALISRIGRSPQFPIAISMHLSTLIGERGDDIVSGKPEQAAHLREIETRRLISLLRKHVLDAREIVFLLGDFNATLLEPSLQYLTDEGGFTAATPDQGKQGTHPKVDQAIDHIFLFPPERIVHYESHIVDTQDAHQASDHLPVVIDVTVS